MLSCLSRKVSDEKVVLREELTKKRSPPPCKAVKKSVRFADSEPSNNEKEFVKGWCDGNEAGEKRTGIRVKVKMTKKEAAKLLSKCKEGGVLQFKDVAPELVALPLNRVTVVSTLHQ
ncbi:uncharacterized protein LOC113869908 [Abrus precatorius]|uniref:Uncharacterized protein LOC113869908 n=1 Tax=Abrus precatorius TaxID=3816 RepID=A0A8B8M2Q4_ABRPR|nr:uncharacterized protein LOC113869908 [Abrus precatorius]